MMRKTSPSTAIIIALAIATLIIAGCTSEQPPTPPDTSTPVTAPAEQPQLPAQPAPAPEPSPAQSDNLDEALQELELVR